MLLNMILVDTLWGLLEDIILVLILAVVFKIAAKYWPSRY